MNTFSKFRLYAVTDWMDKIAAAHRALERLSQPAVILASSESVALNYATPITIAELVQQVLPTANKFGVDFRVLADDGNTYYVRQTELTDEQLKQQDAVDALVLGMINAAHEALGLEFIDHDIDAIGAARDMLIEFLTSEGHVEVATDFYAELTEQEE